jgi:hypothetical protein
MDCPGLQATNKLRQQQHGYNTYVSEWIEGGSMCQAQKCTRFVQRKVGNLVEIGSCFTLLWKSIGTGAPPILQDMRYSLCPEERECIKEPACPTDESSTSFAKRNLGYSSLWK